MKPAAEWRQEGKGEREGGRQSGRVGAPWKALRIPRHWLFPEGSQALGIWDLSLVWVPAEGQDVMESHSPSQEDRQLWSCRETGVTTALLEEGVPQEASPAWGGTGWGGVEKELLWGSHRRLVSERHLQVGQQGQEAALCPGLTVLGIPGWPGQALQREVHGLKRVRGTEGRLCEPKLPERGEPAPGPTGLKGCHPQGRQAGLGVTSLNSQPRAAFSDDRPPVT